MTDSGGGADRDQGPSAVVFDLYGTLLDVGSLVAVCEQALPGAPSAEIVPLWRQKQLEYTWLRALMGRYADFWVVTGDALEHAAARLGISLDETSRARLMDGWLSLRPYPEVPDALAEMAPVPLAVISNGTPRMLDSVLSAAGIADRFAHVLSVDEVGTYKPAPAVYELAERALEVPRGGVLFVTANGWDGAGAASFGFRVARLDRFGQPEEALGWAPDVVVPDLAALARRLTAGALWRA